jgi:hypothetical protein
MTFNLPACSRETIHDGRVFTCHLLPGHDGYHQDTVDGVFHYWPQYLGGAA